MEKIEDFGNARSPSDNHPFPTKQMQHKIVKWQSNVPVINGGRYGEGSKRVRQRPGYRQWRLIEKGDGDWWRVGESEEAWSQRARESVAGKCRGRVMAESEGEWTGKEWTGVVRRLVWKCKANSIFYLPSYAFINDHFLIGNGHVCYASVAQGWR